MAKVCASRTPYSIAASARDSLAQNPGHTTRLRRTDQYEKATTPHRLPDRHEVVAVEDKNRPGPDQAPTGPIHPSWRVVRGQRAPRSRTGVR